jgi:hypothetical protein
VISIFLQVQVCNLNLYILNLIKPLIIDSMVSQHAIPSRKHLGGYNPYVFTEQGVAMLSTVLNSDRAIEVNIQIMRAFVKLREMLSTHKDLARKLADMEKKYDTQFKVVFDAIR